MWMRNGRIRLSENCAAITGLDTDISPYSDTFNVNMEQKNNPTNTPKSLGIMLHRTSRKTEGWKWAHSLGEGWISDTLVYVAAMKNQFTEVLLTWENPHAIINLKKKAEWETIYMEEEEGDSDWKGGKEGLLGCCYCCSISQVGWCLHGYVYWVISHQ